MELGAGAALFTRFCYDTDQHSVELLRELVELMQARATRLRGHTRLHSPTLEHLLGLLLSQGRAVGISVVAAVQDPAKETLPVRQLFTVRIGLRMTEATQTAMVLGHGARDGGAECDLIPDGTPGVGYVMIDGTADPLRVRAFHVTDRDITALARTFRAPRPGDQGNR